ncbi:MAG: putative metal-binding motif-containing protein, partial [Deltaproteobacteria bacterium]|nr:putative metal-binding motif-containing protein [Deltaproteobacteria bacterium]
EICDGIDNDCDTVVPSNENDSDHDGVRVCALDCDDSDPARFPGNPEICDGIDNDCDNIVPSNESDGDGDSYMVCQDDCDDGNPNTYPFALEICDGEDNDCDFVIPATESDADHDGYMPCEGDCDDSNPARFLGNPEVCDGYDNNCDNILPANESDADHDGFMPCTGDCVDTDGDIHPGHSEDCDGKDNNCDGETDTVGGVGICGIGEPCVVGEGRCEEPYYCQYHAGAGENRCTNWCNNSLDTPGALWDHECPDGFSCQPYSNTDSAGFCWPNTGGTKRVGETCSDDSDCRSEWCDTTLGRCIGGCSTTQDCISSGAYTLNWRCILHFISSPNGDMTHGLCKPEDGSGWTGDYCTNHDQCRDGFCFANECLNLCCNEQDCPGNYLCDPWDGETYYSSGSGDSVFKACYDYGLSLGSGQVGDPCTVQFSPWFSSNCQSGLCWDFGSGPQCFRLCCQDADCPSGWSCDFAFYYPYDSTIDGLVRACIPD